MKNWPTIFIIAVISLSTSCSNRPSQDQSKVLDKSDTISPFEVKFVNSDFSMGYSMLFVLNEKELRIISKDDEIGKSDSLLFYKKLNQSDTLQEISNINLGNLKDYYYNECIKDGLQMSIALKKGNIQKTIRISNYYQEDIGKVIYLVNSLIPSQYRIWYDKEKLLEDYKRCND